MTCPDQHRFDYYRSEGRLYAIGTPKTRFAITGFSGRFPQIFPSIEPTLYLIDQQQGCVALEILLEKTTSALVRGDLKLSLDDQAIIDFCRAKARSCERICARLGYSEIGLKNVERILEAYSFGLPKGQTLQGVLKRTEDERWWRKRVRQTQAKTLDGLARQFGLVSKQKGVYVSDWGFRLNQAQKTRNRSLLEEMTAINDLGDEYTLSELAELSVSNPKIRRAELITRCAGFEALAQKLGDAAVFLTVTTPSKYHPVRVSGEYNPKYCGATVSETQHYLTKLWSQVRAQLAREDIRTYGFRIVEPHHDGTPHWHLMLFVDPANKDRLNAIAKQYALLEDGNEPGAEEARFKSVDIDYTQGSATGYIVKYICKNIDGDFKEDGEQAEDWYGNPADAVAPRVTAWASIHNVRQFQQIGGPPVTVWRELRRMGHAGDEVVEAARVAADKGDWATFVECMAGPCAKRTEHPIKAARWIEFDSATGEYIDSPVNQYGENSAGKLFGLFAQGRYWITRFYHWEIQEPIRKKLPVPKYTEEDWKANLQRLMDYQEPTEQEFSDLPADTAFAWERMTFGAAGLLPLEFCQ